MNKIAIIVILSALAYIVAPVPAAAGDRSVQRKKIKRVVLVTIDTLRADHLGYMGYPRDTSPFLDRLAHEGVLFKNAFTVIPYTAPSHASIFTSLYPMQHNVIDNRSEFDKKKFVTMAEYLKEHGYETAAFVSVVLLTQLFHQGFDHMEPAVDQPFSTRKDAAAVVTGAIDWMSKRPSGDAFFLWIHLFDPHTPYAKEIEYKESPRDALKGKDRLGDFWINTQGIEPDLFKDDKKESIWNTMNMYDGEIQFVDSQIRRLYEFMEGKGFNDRSLWIVTSDHGEGLSSHFFFGHHARVYDEELRAPIILLNPGDRNRVVIDDLVENIDILPTLAELVGLSLNKSAVPIEGRSLVPIIKGKRKKHRDYIFSEGGESDKVHCEKATNQLASTLPLSSLILRCADGGNKFSLRDQDYKYIHNPEGQDEFYNLRDDPRELRNLGSTNSRKKDHMKKLLSDFVERMGKKQPVKTESEKRVDDKDELQEETLRSLGY